MTMHSANSPKQESPFAPWPSVDSTSDAPSARETRSTHTTERPASSQSTFAQTDRSSGFATTARSQEVQEGTIIPAHAARLKERGLDPSLCAQLGVHSLPGAVGFTYRVRGAEHNVKIRRGKGDMPWAHAGRDLVLWNLDSLADEPESDEFVVITEGEFDAIACVQAGFTRVVSVPNGAQTGEHGFKYLYRGEQIIPDLAKFQRYVLATDGDDKGLACRDALAIRLGEERCSHVIWPEGCKDANDVLREKGAPALFDLITDARPMLTDEVCTMDLVPDPGEEVRYRLGFPELDHHGFRITLPAFWSIIGPYGSGKSVLLRQILCSLWERHGWPCLLTSFEERIKPRYQRDLRRNLIGRASIPDRPWTAEEIAKADDEINRGFVFLRRKKFETLDLDRLVDRIEYSVKVYGVKVVAIDPVNEIDHRPDRDESRTEYMGRFIRTLKALGDDYGLLTICLAHPPKDGVEKRLQKNGLLTLNDGADSAHWGNKSDIGWCVWRDIDGPTMLHIDKLKDHETMGKPTMAELTLNRALNQFSIGRMGYELLTRHKQAEQGVPA